MNTIYRSTRLIIGCVLLAMCSTTANADDNLNYVLAPLRTQLQRAQISPKASALLVVNAGVFAQKSNAKANQNDSLENNPDAAKTADEKLRADLRALSASKSKNELLLIVLQFAGNVKVEEPSVARIKQELKELAIEAGFSSVQFQQEWTSVEWDDGSGALGSGLLDDSGDEDLIVNKTLVAAPMRTRISKLRIGSGDVFIKLRRPFDALNLELSENTQEVIRHAVQSMRLNSTQKIVFHVSSTKAGAQKVEELFSNRQPPKIPDDAPPIVKQLLQAEIEKFKFAPALQLARELGFKEVVCRHSPNSGAPELLLQHEAPAFELSGLDGKPIQWPEWRGDRPALITFWGVACGPCCLEAPHLSRLHEKYGSKIAILGINAYDEPLETVQAYVSRENLKHPIVIGGRELAKSIYHVTAYPTTFWIDRHGKVVRYEIGFENSEVLEAELIEFIDKAK